VIHPGNSLEVWRGDELVYADTGKWLHPLFGLEKFLSGSDHPREELFLEDKIVGRGAAFLIVRMGLRRVRAQILSRPGLEVLRGHGVDVSWASLVDRISCRTEELLQDMTDPEAACELLKARAAASGA